MTAMNSSSKEIWKKIEDLVNQQVPYDQDFKDIPIEKTIAVLTFQRITSIDEFIKDQAELIKNQSELIINQAQLIKNQSELISEFRTKFGVVADYIAKDQKESN